MPRYFIEVAYRGTQFSGFQIQENANTIQAEIEKAFAIIHRRPVSLTGSSRTDAGVHALQNYFHFDEEGVHEKFLYKMNAVLPPSVVIRNLHEVSPASHSRFDAESRSYEYHIYRRKDPFLQGLAYYYPYQLNRELLHMGAGIIREETNFFAFTKTNTQAKNFRCEIMRSEWEESREVLVYHIRANRFLRGMVRLLTGSMLQLGREKISPEDFRNLFRGESEKAGFSVPAEGLFLASVRYPENYFL